MLRYTLYMARVRRQGVPPISTGRRGAAKVHRGEERGTRRQAKQIEREDEERRRRGTGGRPVDLFEITEMESAVGPAR